MDLFIVLEWQFLDYIFFSHILFTHNFQIYAKHISAGAGGLKETFHKLYIFFPFSNPPIVFTDHEVVKLQNIFFISLIFSIPVSDIFPFQRSMVLRKFFELNFFVYNIKLVRFNILDYIVVKQYGKSSYRFHETP